jgi:hypothetical protein
LCKKARPIDVIPLDHPLWWLDNTFKKFIIYIFVHANSGLIAIGSPAILEVELVRQGDKCWHCIISWAKTSESRMMMTLLFILMAELRYDYTVFLMIMQYLSKTIC